MARDLPKAHAHFTCFYPTKVINTVKASEIPLLFSRYVQIHRMFVVGLLKY
jgi:hypothetical protein